jgi:hypothetical protein
MAHEIANQLRCLAESHTDCRSVRSLFWKNQEEQLPHTEAAWKKYAGAITDTLDMSPTEVFRRVVELRETHWLSVRDCQHGDLHLGLDYENSTAHAYIIDAGAMGPAVAGRDLATLEVSLLLHQKYPGQVSLVDACAQLYDRSKIGNGIVEELDDLPAVHRNTMALTKNIREEAISEIDERVYSCLLLDQALIQLGTLSYGTSQNMIYRAQDAAALCRILSGWVKQEFLNKEDRAGTHLWSEDSDDEGACRLEPEGVDYAHQR